MFLPDGQAKTISVDGHNIVVGSEEIYFTVESQVVDGPIVKHVIIAGPKDAEVLQTYTLYEGNFDIEIETEVDIR